MSGVLSAGDVGANVAEQLAAAHPDRVSALHLTNLPPGHLRGLDPAALSRSERDALASAQHWQAAEGGYIAEQSTKPHTLAAGLGDSPVGLAAWIVEKLRSWSDCNGDVESVFARDDLLTWVTAYWVTGAIGTSFSPYVEGPQPVGRVEPPTAMSIYPHDIKIGTRTLAERFLNIRSWVEHDSGGHFAAWEQPETYVQDIQTPSTSSSDPTIRPSVLVARLTVLLRPPVSKGTAGWRTARWPCLMCHSSAFNRSA